MKKQTAKWVCLALGVMIIVATVVEALFLHHGEHAVLWEQIPGADIVIGAVGAVILIIIAKVILTRILQKKEDYYGDSDA